MSDLVINIQTPGNMTIENTVIPGDYLNEQVISELIDELNLPRMTENGQPIEYVLFSVSHRATLPQGKSLQDSGVQNGDTVKLVSSHDVETDGAGRFDSSAAIDDGFIDVILSVLDINKSERVALELDREIGDVLRQVVHTYNLPLRGKFDELLTYHITSKAMGARLDRAKTLRQEKVPHLDRLTVTREEVAGA
ncbi:MAG TPA: hypothetical protein VJ749_05390 [Pyrinomonadaceae bacterium]|jgi:hypothetical protein|nr:hypothetical protein [Pyrinomonadaceae bacterium]